MSSLDYIVTVFQLFNRPANALWEWQSVESLRLPESGLPTSFLLLLAAISGDLFNRRFVVAGSFCVSVNGEVDIVGSFTTSIRPHAVQSIFFKG